MGVSGRLNKRGFGITSTFYAIIVAGVFLVALGYIFASGNAFYGSNVPYDLDAFNRNNNVSQTIQDYESRLSPDNANPGTDFEATTFTGAFGIISTLFAAFGVAFGSNGMINMAAQYFNAPPFITQAILAMALVGVVMGIVAIVFRLGRRI